MSRLITMIVGGPVKRFFENAVNTIYRDAIPCIEIRVPVHQKLPYPGVRKFRIAGYGKVALRELRAAGGSSGEYGALEQPWYPRSRAPLAAG
jgi:hypothetical protein